MTWTCLAPLAAALFCCGFFAFRQALHLFQLSSYQDGSYLKAVKTHKKDFRSIRRILPCIVMLLGAVSFSSMPWMTLAGMLLYLLLNRPKKAKKPLVYTARVKRLLCCAGILAVLWLLLLNYASTCLLYAALVRQSAALARWSLLLPVLAVVLTILWEHRLVLLCNDLMSPIEHAISQHYYKDAQRILESMPELTVIGITGSYGKTSTKYFLERLLSLRYNVYMTPGNYNTTLGVVRAVREGLRPTHQIFLCEMGARHVGDIAEICQLVHPSMGIITSVGPQHLDTFGTLTNVLNTKLELAAAVKGKGPVFLNFDSVPLANHAPQQQVISYGQEGIHYHLSDLRIDENGSCFTVTAPDGQRQSFSTRLLGQANVQNICGAIAVANTLDIPLAHLAPAVRQLEGAPHRLQLLRQPGLTIIDDAYNSNPAGAKNALETLALCRGLRIAVTPGLVELGEQEQEYNETLGRQAAACCHWLITVGDQPRTEAIRQGAREGGLHRERILEAKTVQQAMELARGLPAEEGRFVLLLNDLTDNY